MQSLVWVLVQVLVPALVLVPAPKLVPLLAMVQDGPLDASYSN